MNILLWKSNVRFETGWEENNSKRFGDILFELILSQKIKYNYA